jgi:hypothetical protein
LAGIKRAAPALRRHPTGRRSPGLLYAVGDPTLELSMSIVIRPDAFPR